MIKQLLIVGLGGSIGSMSRFVISYFMRSAIFPFHTLLINITGSFIIGIVLGISIKDAGFSNNWRLFFATGICGGFTTFSAFSLENLELLQNGKYLLSFIYIILSIIAGIAAAGLGFKLMVN